MELIEHRVRRVDGRVRLEGEVLYANGTKEVLWFEVDEAFESSLNRTGDPWIVALAPLAVTLREPLRVPLPADPRLVEGLRQTAVIWQFWESTRGDLELEVPTCRAQHPEAVRTASLFSGGVDSWFTVMRNRQLADAGRAPRLDSLLLVWGADIPLKSPEPFRALRDRLRPIAAELSCELIDVATNIRETRWVVTNWPRLAHGCLFISLAHATGQFRRLLIPSSVTYSHARGWGSHFVTDPLLSSTSTEIVYDAAEYSRLDKVPLLAEFPLALENLRVCWRSGTDQNCGRCMKCLRTMINLELHGALTRCPTFPSTKVDLEAAARIRCLKPNEYRWMRNLAAECRRLGRHDIGRALESAYDRSFRLDMVTALLGRLDRAGLRGAGRVGAWLERDSIMN